MKKIPDVFFNSPASSTGRYHPKYSNTQHGLMLHSIANCHYVIELARGGIPYFVNSNRDILIVAEVCHDVEKSNYKIHAEKAAENVGIWIDEFNKFKEKEVISADTKEKICKSILSHMGIFGVTKPSADEQWAVYLADLISSFKVYEQMEDVLAEIKFKEGEFDVDTSGRAEA